MPLLLQGCGRRPFASSAPWPNGGVVQHVQEPALGPPEAVLPLEVRALLHTRWDLAGLDLGEVFLATCRDEDRAGVHCRGLAGLVVEDVHGHADGVARALAVVGRVAVDGVARDAFFVGGIYVDVPAGFP